MLTWLDNPIKTIEKTYEQKARDHQTQLTKPPGSLGMLEDIAIRLAAMQESEQPSLERVAIRVFAGDHGVVAEGVSAFPQAVTVEMIRNFANGGAAISVLARKARADFAVINMGTVTPLPDTIEKFPQVVNCQLAPGTANFTQAPAMTNVELGEALTVGMQVVDALHSEGLQLFIGGEMGIGNTTAAAAVASALIGCSPDAVVGRGTGVDDAGLKHKVAVIERAIALHKERDTLAVLQCLGGLEIAGLVGAYLRCGQLGLPVLVDGFICSVAALVACRYNLGLAPWLFYAHQSAEAGHRVVLHALQAEPLLSLNMRLGEGSGAAVALPLLHTACQLHNQMATFASAGVSNSDSLANED